MTVVKNDDAPEDADGPASAQRSPTIYDVAQEVGVSISTVSLALNSPERVKATTRERIMGAIDRLGFTPKAEAVIRARRGTGRIGVIAPFTSFPTESSLRLNGIIRGADPVGFEVVVFDQASAATSRLMTLPVTRKVDGLIIVSLPFDDEVEGRLKEHATPTCVLDLPHSGMTNVIIDHHSGGQLVGRYLVERGHRHVAYIGHRQDHDYPSQSLQQLAGFTSVIGTPLVRDVEHTLEAAVDAALDLFGGREPPTAVFAHDDLLAAGVLMAARRAGLRVPDDVAVVGFNDTEIAAPLGLTTVRQPFEESGELAVELLLNQLNEPRSALRSVTLGVTIVERDTT